MCGIAGIARRRPTGVPAELLERMAGAIGHRGPDGFGLHADDRVGLTNVRLSVIDLAQNPPVVRSKTLGTGNPPPYPDPFNASDPLSPPWNQAAFSEKIAVTIKGTYRPLLPTFLLMPSTLSINITAVMGSEG